MSLFKSKTKRAMENISESLAEVMVPNAKVAEIAESGTGIDIRFVYSGKNQLDDIVDQNLLRLIHQPLQVFAFGQRLKRGEILCLRLRFPVTQISDARLILVILHQVRRVLIFAGEERFESFEFAPALLDTFLAIAKSEIPNDTDFAEYRQYCIDEFAKTVKRSHAPARYNFPYVSVVSPEVWIDEYNAQRDRNQAQQ